MDGDSFDQFLDEDAPFFIVGVLPDGVELEVGITKQCGGSLECLSECVRGLGSLDGLGVVGFDSVDLGGELSF